MEADGERMIRVEREENRRVALDRAFLEDPRLSFRAKGLLAYLLLRSDEETFDVESVAASFGERTADVAHALKQLESAGYYRRTDEGNADALLGTGTLREVSLLPLLASRHENGPATQRAERNSIDPQSEAETAAAERVLVRLNKLRQASWVWAKYTPLSARHAKNVEHIKGRLREGYGESDLVLVLEYLAAVDGGRDSSRRYFDSVTPFNTKNFERNLAMARDWDARGRPERALSLTLDRPPEHDPAIYEQWAKRGGKK
ncbi:MAG: hypothetical protein NTY18_05970 [Deltaproteobacteria bacterium]|nr:hypothetical protein [Deltaproteobacteria bacterium]